MSTARKRKNMSSSLQEYVVKLSVMLITIVIGLWCGWHDSFGAFYIASLVQAINNMYDSFQFLKGYNRFVTVFQLLAFVGGLIAAVLSIIHFSVGGTFVDTKDCLYLISICLGIPILHILVEIYLIIRNDAY